jgi:hypothetical protein
MGKTLGVKSYLRKLARDARPERKSSNIQLNFDTSVFCCEVLMPVCFDLSSIFPYIFTIVSVFGGGCFFTLIITLIVFFALGKKTINSPAQSTEVKEKEKPRYLTHPIFSPGQIEDELLKAQRAVGEVYPPNKISIKCHGCRSVVPRGEGYTHYNVGVRGGFCVTCHTAQNLPLRSDDGVVLSEKWSGAEV